MEQFNLDTWLQDKSRKICTRDGRPVRIVCWDIKSNTPIIAAIQWNDEREDCYFYNTIGRCANNVAEIDLFFADVEERLNEFEKAVKQVIWTAYNYDDCSNGKDVDDIYNVKATSKTLLDLARKELLKDLPKWKKATEKKEMDYYVALYEDEERVVMSAVLYKGEYYLELDDLKTLPKEE